MSDGEVRGRGGGAICCEVRLEVVLDVRRGDEARGRGEGGTVLRSGAMVLSGWLSQEGPEDVVIEGTKDVSKKALSTWSSSVVFLTTRRRRTWMH